jgi:hypothetical protein
MKQLLVTVSLSFFMLIATKSTAQTALPSGKTGSQNAEVISISELKVERKEAAPVRDDEKLAFSMLNTKEIPKDFPRMRSDMSSVTYEKLVFEWFQMNPDKRK